MMNQSKYDCSYNCPIEMDPMTYDYVADFKIRREWGKDCEGGVGMCWERGGEGMGVEGDGEGVAGNDEKIESKMNGFVEKKY